MWSFTIVQVELPPLENCLQSVFLAGSLAMTYARAALVRSRQLRIVSCV